MNDLSIAQALPNLRIARFRQEIDAAVASVLGGAHYILGAPVERFEAAFAAHEGREHAVGVGSGTDALALALRALGVGPGDEVVTAALTFAGTAQAILHCGARPLFADVDPHTWCITAETVEAVLTPSTRAILPVHLFGFPADMAALCAFAAHRGLAVVSDCAQAHGARIGPRPLGSFGDAAAYSFYPTKNLGCVGDGGAVLVDDPVLAGRLRALREYGFSHGTRISREAGFNSRLDTLQAAILSALLPHLDAGNRERRAIAGRYRAALAGLNGLRLQDEHPGGVSHQFAVAVPNRGELAMRLADEGIRTAIHYHPGLHRHPAFADPKAVPLPVSDRLSASLLSLPIQPEVAGAEVERIASAVREAYVR
ncbi:DegT/DnrJ/EryC1/StrS family aminotransferase [Methylobacterium sp. E-025]|uniref:DegT/DnrJ/EryC1/StrS family aminotransferase n=1 Tax=Methylobacterium sp. E-025 TaxID=2836561 RepID=UPI001FB8CF13|nr:DegT/DnrJ/EryC1/StrS family aminotransferase [Methylobacterium sp. E-025]MCJ2112841.1 DegT/DnrJ/EryC1/StrS family aminotransferase [Methylobacterium sp. E-025]